MDKFWDRFKKLIVTTWKTVIHSKRKFLPFLLAALLMEFALFTVTMTFDSAMENQKQTVENTYDYHFTVTGLDRARFTYITEQYITEIGQYGVYTAVNPKGQQPNGSYIAYIRLELHADTYSVFEKAGIDSSLQGLFDEFVYRYTYQYPILNDEGVSVVLSPLFTLEEDIAAIRTARNLSILLIALLSLVSMIALYRNRTDSERFLYGIYATFGANTRRLRLSAFCELFLCTLLPLLPAYYLSSITAAVLFATGNSLPFRFIFLNPALIGISLLIMAVVSLFSVYLPMKIISRTEPMKLIVAEDNSNLVSRPSPKTGTANIRFPFGYSVLSMFRFRRHHLMLAITSGFFSILFIVGVYLSGVYQQNFSATAKDTPEFHITFSYENAEGEHVNVVSRQTIDELFGDLPRGVSSIHRNYASSKASSLGIYLSVPASSVSGGDFAHLSDGNFATSDLFMLCAVDEDLPKYVEETYPVIGDITRVASGDEPIPCIAIGISKDNQDVFSYEIGDVIMLSRMVTDENGNPVPLMEEDTSPIPSYYSGNQLLEQQVLKYTYESRSYRICALIGEYPSAAYGIPVIMPSEEYQWLTDDIPVGDALDIRVNESISPADYRTLRTRLECIDSENYAVSVECANRYVKQYVESRTPYVPAVIAAVSVTLILIPVLWFFTQILFFRRRESEFYILQSISAPLSTVRKIYLQSAVIMLPIGVASAILSYGLVRLIHWLLSYFLPMYFAMTGNTVISFSVSPVQWILCFTVILFSSVLSSYLPYLGYRRRFLREQQQENLYQE